MLFRKDFRLSGEDEPKSEVDKIIEIMEGVGVRDRKSCRYGFSWKDYVEVCQGERGCVERGREVVKNYGKTKWKDVTDIDDIPDLLKKDPEAGIKCLAAQPYRSESTSVPFGRAERIVGESLMSGETAVETKAKIFLTFAIDPRAHDCPVEEAKDIPSGLLDFEFARKWYCDHRKPGWEYVRCSDADLFSVAVNWDSKTPMDKKLNEAIDKEQVSQFVMNLALAGQGAGARMLNVLLYKKTYKILNYLIRNDTEFRKRFDEKALLFYACAHWDAKHAKLAIEESEKLSPGICKRCIDGQGRDLLWYLRYHNAWDLWRGYVERFYGDHVESLAPVLESYGCDPKRKTIWGLPFDDIRSGCIQFPYEVYREDDGVVVISAHGYKVGEYIPPCWLGAGKILKEEASTHNGFGVCTDHDWPEVTYGRVRLFEFKRNARD